MELLLNEIRSIVCENTEKELIVTPYLCFRLSWPLILKRVTLSDFAYGEYLFYENENPAYYFNAFDTSLNNTILQQLIESSSTNVQDLIFTILKATVNKNISKYSFDGWAFQIGHPYTSSFTVKKLTNVLYG
jgi:hypothetical protein